MGFLFFFVMHCRRRRVVDIRSSISLSTPPPRTLVALARDPLGFLAASLASLTLAVSQAMLIRDGGESRIRLLVLSRCLGKRIRLVSAVWRPTPVRNLQRRYQPHAQKLPT